MKLSEIQDLIKFIAKSGVSEVELQIKDLKIIVKTPTNGKGGQSPVVAVPVTAVPVAAVPAVAPAATPVQEAKPSEAKKESAPVSDDSKYVTIKSPMIGTFYRSPSPDKPPFVNIGDEIKKGKPICIIEAMKLFNEIESDIDGRIVKVVANDASPVEYDQPLFLVEPL